MELKEHKKEMKQNVKTFFKKMTEEHGCSIEHAKTILISEVLDSANEIGAEVK